MRAFLDWLDHRTGYRKFISAMLLEHIPGGAKWRYVWGSCLAFVFLLQLITGVLLMMSYSPGDSTAWSSVYFIQYEMDFGWLIRGLHHFGSQTMVVLLGLHMLQVVIAGAHLPPREVNWWLGLALMAVVLGLSLTGYLLPWDQKGYWATQVATNIAGDVPVIGPFIQRLLVGGSQYGHQTLTRFFALHVAILPGLLIILLIAHLAVFRRHGVTAPREAEGEDTFYPRQVFKDLVACMVVFAIMLYLVISGHGHHLETAHSSETGWYESWAHAGRDGRGANLDAPADPSRPYPARPEWYFLFLFQLLKYFEGDYKLIGTVLIPNGAGVLLFLLPFLGYGKMRPVGHVFGVLVVTGLLAGAASLTCFALADDTVDPVARALLNRVGTGLVPLLSGLFLIHLGVLALLRKGGLRRGVFAIGSAVVLLLAVVTGLALYAGINNQIPRWAADLLQSRMREDEKLSAAAILDREEQAKKEAALQKSEEPIQRFEAQIPGNTRKWAAGILKFTEQLKLAGQSAERSIQLAHQGVPPEGAVMLLRNDPLTQFKPVFLKHCASCHSYGEFGGATWKTSDLPEFQQAKFSASDLAGFATKEWIYEFLKDPGHERFYGRSKMEVKDEQGKVVKDDKGHPQLEPRFTRMAGEIRRLRKKASKQPDGEQKLLEDFAKIADWLASHSTSAKPNEVLQGPGYQLFIGYNCTSCHKYVDPDSGTDGVPDLTGYASQDWIRRMLRSPDHPYLYGARNAMPSFRDLEGPTIQSDREEYAKFVGKDLKELRFSHLTDIEREILVRYFTRDYRVIFGGQAITGVKKN